MESTPVIWTDCMVDTETTGVDPDRNAIIQLSGIKFNLAERKVGPMFDRCPSRLPKRMWSDDTREFWLSKNRPVYDSIIARSEPGLAVFTDFFRWVGQDAAPEGLRFWAKPVTFDWGFVASHMEQCDLPMPFHYRYARDMNSFMAGLNGNADHPSVENEVPFPEGGSLHNALHDAAWQIDQLFYAMRRNEGS